MGQDSADLHGFSPQFLGFLLPNGSPGGQIEGCATYHIGFLERGFKGELTNLWMP